MPRTHVFYTLVAAFITCSILLLLVFYYDGSYRQVNGEPMNTPVATTTPVPSSCELWHRVGEAQIYRCEDEVGNTVCYVYYSWMNWDGDISCKDS